MGGMGGPPWGVCGSPMGGMGGMGGPPWGVWGVPHGGYGGMGGGGAMGVPREFGGVFANLIL